jgi:phage terminase large subunit-like protein
MASRDYIKLANQYTKDVLSGKIPACKHVKNACERQQNDLKRKDLPYKFDKEKASKICKFIEVLPHIKGIWAGKPIVLEPWQIFILTTVFGWVDKQGLRRFKTAYTEVPRKNAKSTLSSGVALYMLCADGEGGPEVYSAATTRDQAKIVWEDAKRMVDRCGPLREYFGVQTSAHSVFVPGNAGVFKALARDSGGNLDGLNIHCAIIDELHAHKTREVWDVTETATGARFQSLIWGITTAGFNRTGICYEQRAYSIKILDRVHVDEEYFGIIYTIDEGDDWTDPLNQQKANPNWGVSVNPEDIARKARKAMEMAAATNNFLTKHLNVWVNADTAWMNMRAWDACADPTLRIEDFIGEECWVGVDLATVSDVAAMAILFKRKDEFYLFGKYYLPEETAEDPSKSHYQGWARQGIFTLTPGNVTDYEYILDDIRALCETHRVKFMGFDPYQASHILNILQGEGLPVGKYPQQVAYMSAPMKQLEALILSNKLKHNGDPVMTWMISNVVCHMDAKENVYPRKEFPENKIDGAVAAIMALGEAMSGQEEEKEAYIWTL